MADYSFFLFKNIIIFITLKIKVKLSYMTTYRMLGHLYM